MAISIGPIGLTNVGRFFVPQSPVTETVTVDKWYVPPPGPPNPNYTVTAATFGFVVQLPFVSTFTAWSEPQRRKVQVQAPWAFPFAPTQQVEWLRPFADPQRGPQVRPQQPLSFLYTPIAAPAETITVDKWYRPFDAPAPQKSTKLDIFSFLAPLDTALAWYVPLSIPQRILARPQNQWSFVYAPPETITVDKWNATPPGPLPRRANITSVTSSGVVPVQNAIEWYRAFVEPQRVRANIQQAPWTFLFTPAAAVETVTADKWFQNLSQPRSPGYTVSISVVGFSVVEAAAAVVPPTSRQKDGDPDYWKLPWFQVEGGTFAERLRATALDSLYALPEAADVKAVSSAAKAVHEYVEAAGMLLSDKETAKLGELARQLHQAASQKQDDLQQRVRDTRALLLAQALQQDEEEALIALGIY